MISCGAIKIVIALYKFRFIRSIQKDFRTKGDVMVEIKYIQSESGYDNCFGIVFNHKAYIPNVFFEQHKSGDGAELYFFISLLHKFGMFDFKKEHYHQLIYNTHYDCIYNGIPFTMIYDEDYDMVSFSVAPENMQHKTTIAERMQQLVKTESKNVDVLEFNEYKE